MQKLLPNTLLYSCFIALVHCNITHNRGRKTPLKCWTISVIYIINAAVEPILDLWLHIIFCTYWHTEHTQLEYCIIDSVNVETQDARNRHVSALWLFCLLPLNVTTFSESGCPANSELGGGSSLQTFDCWGEVRGSDSVQCVTWRQWQRTSQERKNGRSNFRTGAVWGYF